MMQYKSILEKCWAGLLIPALLTILGCFTCFTVLDAQDDLSYKVTVSNMMIPVFAVDTKGNPVYDLDKSELDLFVNGRAVQFRFFPFVFEDPADDSESTAMQGSLPRTKAFKRVVFVIIDAMFNSKKGLKRSKQLVKKLVTESFRGDTFVILENSPGGGLRHIAGPERDREKILEGVASLNAYPERYKEFLFKSPGNTNLPERAHDSIHAIRSAYYLQRLTRTAEAVEKDRYRERVKQFGYAVSRFKYALKTISGPKVVFLISEGIAKGAFSHSYKAGRRGISSESMVKPFLLKYFEGFVDAVNSGGSVLYTVNPRSVTVSTMLDTENSGDFSLKYMSAKSGGKYFSGQDIQTVADEIKNTTKAYYELAFPLPPEMDDKSVIDVKCKRKGVVLFNPRLTERETPYKQMEPAQKRVFALDVVTGGSWSRIRADIEEAGHTRLKTTKKKGKTVYTLAVDIPREMQNRDVDIFVLEMNKKTKNHLVRNFTRQAKEREILEIETGKGNDFFFVIVDPASTRTIYGGELF
jgi:VWFA-related protein